MVFQSQPARWEAEGDRPTTLASTRDSTLGLAVGVAMVEGTLPFGAGVVEGEKGRAEAMAATVATTAMAATVGSAATAAMGATLASTMEVDKVDVMAGTAVEHGLIRKRACRTQGAIRRSRAEGQQLVFSRAQWSVQQRTRPMLQTRRWLPPRLQSRQQVELRLQPLLHEVSR